MKKLYTAIQRPIRRLALTTTSLYALLGLVVIQPAHAQSTKCDWIGATTGIDGGAANTSQTRATTVDAEGNVFVTGIFTGHATFGNTVLTSNGSTDMFVAKYVPSTGTWAWAQSGGGHGSDAGFGIAVSESSVYVTGNIQNDNANTNSVVFGGASTPAGTVQLSGASSILENDIVVAKYTDNGSTATLSWTQVAGGTGPDQGQAIAVSGNNVYVTGFITNSTSNTNAVVFGGTGTSAGAVQQNGASSSSGYDLVVAKYIDNGANATLGWTQVAGGTSGDFGYGIAVNGASVYVTGYIYNDLANNANVVFGGAGTVPGAIPQSGASSALTNDIIVAKYTDNGPTATLGWTQVAGGTDNDTSYGIAVSGTSVYVTGNITNNLANSNQVLFGGSGLISGTVSQSGASSTLSNDVLVAKYTDNGVSATLGWTQVGGGTGSEGGYGIIAKDNFLYVVGNINNDATNSKQVVFGGASPVSQNGVSNTVSDDVLVAKYTDIGSSAALDWTQVGGGAQDDFSYGVAISGQRVYVSGFVVLSASFGAFDFNGSSSSSVNFLSQISDMAIPLPVELVRFSATTAGPAAVRLAWATASEKNSAYFNVERSLDGVAFATVGQVPAVGSTSATHTYTLTDAALPGGATTLYYRLRQVDLDGSFYYSPVSSVALAGATAKLAVYPNPMHAVATLVGAAPTIPVQVLDTVGKLVWSTTTDAAGAAQLPLPAGLPAGLYVVRAGSQATQLVVQ